MIFYARKKTFFLITLVVCVCVCGFYMYNKKFPYQFQQYIN